METTNYFVNIDAALPISCNGALKLYKSKIGTSFICRCGNTYYKYTFDYLPPRQLDNDEPLSSYKLKDVIDTFALFDAHNLKRKSPTLDFKCCYEKCLLEYTSSFERDYDRSVSYLRNIIDSCFESRVFPFDFFVTSVITDEKFMRVINAVYFFDDAAKALYEYRHGSFKICKISPPKKSDLKNDYVLVAENKLDKNLFEFIMQDVLIPYELDEYLDKMEQIEEIVSRCYRKLCCGEKLSNGYFK